MASRVLERKSIREIARELAVLPRGEAPSDCSRATIGRDVLALRAEWSSLRAQAVEQVMAEDLARLNTVERVLWPLVVDGNGEAIDRWRSVRSDRERLLQPSGGGGRGGVGVQVAAGAGAVRIEVEFVDDWRSALVMGWGSGEGEGEGEGEGAGLGAPTGAGPGYGAMVAGGSIGDGEAEAGAGYP